MEHLLRATARAEARHFWFRGFRSFVTPLIAQAADGRSDLRLLDAGCGTGANVELLQRFGRGFGFDLSETGVRLGREAGRTRLARATVTAAPFPSGAFDVVTSFDVLYSLQDDARAQNEISVPSAPVNALLAGALRLEAAWLRRFDVPFGSSLLCVARKPTAART